MSLPKRRMLFLHGMFLPPECYEHKLLVEFMDVIGDTWQTIFVESPRPCPDPVPPAVSDMFPDLDRHPEWINSHSNVDGSKTYRGLAESLAFLRSFLKKEPKFDAIAGHSNGALMASILSMKMESDPEWMDKEKHWSAVILCNAPGSYETETQLKDIVERCGPVKIPSVHVWGGPTDLTWEGEQKLKAVHHPTGKVVQHEAGHLFPKKEDGHMYYDQIAKALNEIDYKEIA